MKQGTGLGPKNIVRHRTKSRWTAFPYRRLRLWLQRTGCAYLYL